LQRTEFVVVEPVLQIDTRVRGAKYPNFKEPLAVAIVYGCCSFYTILVEQAAAGCVV